MKKYIQKLSKFLNLSKMMVVFLIGLLVIGVISGSLFLVILSKTDQKIVSEYLSDFIVLIQTNKFNGLTTMFSSVSFNYIYAFIIWIFGISIIGLPVVIFMFFGKTFTLGFTISTIIKKYGIKGCFLTLGYVFPHYIINIFVFSILTLYSATLSIKMIKSIIARKSVDFKYIMKKYSYVLIVSLGILLLSGIYESFVMPKILKMILKYI